MAATPLVLVFWALSPLAVPVELEPQVRPSTVRLVWYDGERLLPRGLDPMTREVESLFAPLGVELEWVHGVGGEMTAGMLPSTHFELKVLLMPVEPATWGLEPNVMGVVMGEGSPRSVIYLFFKNIVRALGYRPRPDVLSQPKESNQVVRALARVLAHEMVHAMAPGHPHHTEGLMSCKLTRGLLLKRDVQFDAETATAFRMELARHVMARRENALSGGRAFFAPFRPKP